MGHTLEKKITVQSSQCDFTGRMGIWQTVSTFVDLATEHAEILKIGIHELMPRGLYWVASKTRIRITRMPAMCEEVTLITWPEKPDRVRSNRSYRMVKDGEVLAEGMTEWAVIDLASGRFQPPRSVFPEDLQLREDRIWDRPFARILDDFTEEPFARYRVRSTDIDVGQHMNNAAYVRAIMGLWSTAEWQAMNLTELEIHYKNACFEGDELRFQKRQAEDGSLQLRASLDDDKTILHVILR